VIIQEKSESQRRLTKVTLFLTHFLKKLLLFNRNLECRHFRHGLVAINNNTAWLGAPAEMWGPKTEIAAAMWSADEALIELLYQTPPPFRRPVLRLAQRRGDDWSQYSGLCDGLHLLVVLEQLVALKDWSAEWHRRNRLLAAKMYDARAQTLQMIEVRDQSKGSKL
jgi:hypothetical protein